MSSLGGEEQGREAQRVEAGETLWGRRMPCWTMVQGSHCAGSGKSFSDFISKG